MPQTSKRAGSRTGSGGVVKAANAKTVNAKTAIAKPGGAGSTRQGPVDPRTEDASSPKGISRLAKTVARRPGQLTPRTTKHRETSGIDAPIEFSVALPLAPESEAPFETPMAKTVEFVPDHINRAEPVALARTVEVATPPRPTDMPTALVPTGLAPAELRTIPVPSPAPAPILYDEAATIDDFTMIGPVLGTRPLQRPVHFRRAPKPRVRRVTRVVRHVDTWSVFKVALVFNVFFYAVALVAGVLLWQVAYATGTIDNVEKFFEGFGWETFDFNGGQIFHNAWIAGLFVAVGLTGLSVLLATLFNLITDLVGGVRFSVLEEEVQARAARGTEVFVQQSAPVFVGEPQVDQPGVPIGAEPGDDAIAG